MCDCSGVDERGDRKGVDSFGRAGVTLSIDYYSLVKHVYEMHLLVYSITVRTKSGLFEDRKVVNSFGSTGGNAFHRLPTLFIYYYSLVKHVYEMRLLVYSRTKSGLFVNFLFGEDEQEDSNIALESAGEKRLL